MPEEHAVSQNRETAVGCLREIIKLLPEGTNLEALLEDFDAADTVESVRARVIALAEKLKLRPEARNDVDGEELLSYFGAPILLALNNGNWVLFLGVRRSINPAESPRLAIFDPLSQTTGKMLFLTPEQLTKSWSGSAVYLRNLSNSGFSADGRHTALYCLAAIARHHGEVTDVNRLRHEYAIHEQEAPLRLLRKMAEDLGFATHLGRIRFARLPKLQNIYPVMGFRQDGKAVVFCGVRQRQPESEDEAGARPRLELGVWDPTRMEGDSRIFFIDEEQYRAEYSGEVLIFKKRYSLLDENQPFRLRWFLPEFYRQKTLLFQVALAILAVSLIGLAIPLFFQLVVDKVLLHRSYTTLTVLGVIVVVLLLGNAILEFLQNYFLLYATNRIDIRLATRTFAKLLSLPVDFYERISSGVLIKHMQQTEKIRSFLSGNLFYSMLELISLAVFLPFLLIYSVKLTLLVLFFTFLMALVIALLIKPFQQRLEELYLAEGKRQGMLVETIQGIRTVKSLALEPAQQRKWNDTAAFAITRYFRVAKISMVARTISQLLEKLMFVAIIWVGAHSVFDGVLSVGALIAFQMLSGRVTSPLVRIVGLVHEYQQTALSVKMLGVVMNTRPEQVGGNLHHQLRGEISLENLRFQYTADGPVVIKNFNFHLPPGTTVGLVGRSGSGKTTVTKLMQGLYPLQGGIIKYDGIDIREIDRASLRSNIGVVLQDNYFFSGTIRENLTVTKKDASMEEVIYAARLAGADEFIQKLSRGYESMLEENASNLSGGQRQRLAIARALLPNPRIMIFDEATSALDPESETLIRRNLKQIGRNRTMLIISHRLSVLCRADVILVMDQGEVVEQGTHAQLMLQNGIYADFWKQQMGVEDV